jgi:hypothetical protein
MSTINITITADVADFIQFADELGYQTEVSKTPEELALLTEPIAIQDRIKPNPQTKQAFLEEYFKNVVVTELYRKKAGVIDAQVNATKEAEKVALKGVLSGVVGVTSVV